MNITKLRKDILDRWGIRCTDNKHANLLVTLAIDEMIKHRNSQEDIESANSAGAAKPNNKMEGKLYSFFQPPELEEVEKKFNIWNPKNSPIEYSHDYNAIEKIYNFIVGVKNS